MRAEKGSIEKVKIDPKTLKPSIKTIGNEKPKGICGSGIIDTVAQMFLTGIINRNGSFKTKRGNENITKTENGYGYILAKNKEKNSRKITITQSDIWEVLKAKGAIQAGIRVLMEKLELGEKDIDQVLLAGAFGNYINKNSAQIIGIYPEIKTSKVKSIGKTAGQGCKLALLSKEKRKEANRSINKVKFTELAGTTKFKKHFARSTFLPHKDLNLYPQKKQIQQ